MTDSEFVNASETGEVPSFDGSEQAKATDFAHYFCSYAQLFHQKHMLVDHRRMAAYHSAILGNASMFKDKVVMDVGTGSGILAVWAAQAGARRVYAVEYTDMAKHARAVVDANGVSDVITVIQGAVEDLVLPMEDFPELEDDGDTFLTKRQQPVRCVDIIVSEWMGYFLLRESMLDSIIRARDKFLKVGTGVMFPSHATMYLAPITDEEERKHVLEEYVITMGEWLQFLKNTKSTYGVDMTVLHNDFEREQREHYLLSSGWTKELGPEAVLAAPHNLKTLDISTCTIADARGIAVGDPGSRFQFDVVGPGCQNESKESLEIDTKSEGMISGFAGWFAVEFKSRTDEEGRGVSPEVENPVFLSTGPESGFTHWGQLAFHFLSPIHLLPGETTRLQGYVEMTRNKKNSRTHDLGITFTATRIKSSEGSEDCVVRKGDMNQIVYQIP